MPIDWPTYLAGIALTTLIAGRAASLFALHHFGRVSSYGMLANLVAIPVTALWIMPSAIVSVLAMPLGLGLLPLRGDGARDSNSLRVWPRDRRLAGRGTGGADPEHPGDDGRVRWAGVAVPLAIADRGCCPGLVGPFALALAIAAVGHAAGSAGLRDGRLVGVADESRRLCTCPAVRIGAWDGARLAGADRHLGP